MSQAFPTKLQEHYHFAKLALFQFRVLARLQAAIGSNEALDNLIECEAHRNNMSERPSLINQSSFLQFAYITLVWLWEAAGTEGQDGLLEEFERIAIRKNLKLPGRGQVHGDRQVGNWRAIIRLLRNAISHGKVVVSASLFRFEDINPGSEKSPTSLELSWADLAQISETMLFAMTPVVYPQTIFE